VQQKLREQFKEFANTHMDLHAFDSFKTSKKEAGHNILYKKEPSTPSIQRDKTTDLMQQTIPAFNQTMQTNFDTTIGHAE